MEYEVLVAAITQAHGTAPHQAVQAVNLALTLRKWLIGLVGADHRFGRGHAGFVQAIRGSRPVNRAVRADGRGDARGRPAG